jgi:NAD(P)-dependent dehydrogenase (short-subunit alcohol dehydrogenase family)
MTQLDTNKVALVIGASSGIGQAIALQLAAMGIAVYAAARHSPSAKHGIDRQAPIAAGPQPAELRTDGCGQTAA